MNYRFIMLLLLFGCGAPSSESTTESTSPPPLPELVSSQLSLPDGSSIPTLQWKDQTWLGQNLQLEVENSFCYEKAETNCEQFGRLYRWEAATEACASLGEGWRLPTDEEWTALVLAFGGYKDWLTDEEQGDARKGNQNLVIGGKSSFDALLGGWRGSAGGYEGKGQTAFYWSSTPEKEEVWAFQFSISGKSLLRRCANPKMGMACRCIKTDQPK
jgi:uncharacterized protein (TIGR02145 family)